MANIRIKEIRDGNSTTHY